jgi:hypothetical protein
VLDATIAPQSRPATRIGLPTLDLIPWLRAISASSPSSPEKSSMRAGFEVSRTRRRTFVPSSDERLPKAAFRPSF